ncbi:methyltransferase domain-containing protein [Candidatus Berkiella cookevillensis]|nr:methyltransferase domain-containing protein [Candidatus Berkiella cookevillensis]MCS5707375.1 methyltransferase domain-containing protein [Candidatus Berkiella cookevillensis]
MNFTILFIFILILIWGGWALRKYIRPYFRRKQLKEWLQHHPKQAQLEISMNALSSLYRFSFSHQVAKFSQITRGLKQQVYLYGEIDLLNFIYILDKLNPNTEDVFYDLGSGAGKAVFTAATAFPFKKAVGIEIIPELITLSRSRLAKYHEQPFDNISHCQIQFIQGDFLEIPLKDATIVFVNATAFSARFWQYVLQKLIALPKNTRVIINTHTLPEQYFNLISQDYEIMSWGLTRVSLYQRR